MRPPARRPLLLALILSLGLHALGLLTVPAPPGDAGTVNTAPIEVALLRPEPPPVEPAPERPRQIVAPPDEINDTPPPQPRFESDRDNTVLRETVRPGVPAPQPARPPRPRLQPQPAEPRREPAARAGRETQRTETRSGHAPALEDLFASTDELVRAQRGHESEAAPETDAADPGRERRRLALAIPPVTPEWSLPGDRGTLDHLPDIQRGDVTLLNTKASVFAPFVRRVGERVFQHLIIRQRRLELQHILTARGPVRMRVVLDPRGRLKSIRVEGRSGSGTMDDTLSDALETAAFDNNPPPTAANADGDYEFVFQAQLRTFQPAPGNLPSRIESRLSVALL